MFALFNKINRTSWRNCEREGKPTICHHMAYGFDVTLATCDFGTHYEVDGAIIWIAIAIGLGVGFCMRKATNFWFRNNLVNIFYE